MKRGDTVTFIVTRNYGRPHTWSLPTWKVAVGGSISLVLLTALVTLGLAFLLLFPQYHQTRKELKNLEQERDALRQQLVSSNQEALNAKERGRTEDEPAARGDAEQDFLPTSATGSEMYSPPIRIGGLNSRLTRDHLEFSFQLASTDKGRGNRGGFVFIVFENQNVDPPQFAVSPAASINGTGFPLFYKEGLIFPRVVDTLNIRRTIRLESPDSLYTNVTIFLFTPRGGLIAKERYQLDRSVFQRESGVDSRKPSQA